MSSIERPSQDRTTCCFSMEPMKVFSRFDVCAQPDKSKTEADKDDKAKRTEIFLIIGSTLALKPNVMSPTKRRVNGICDSRIFRHIFRTNCFLWRFLGAGASYCRVCSFCGIRRAGFGKLGRHVIDICIQDTHSANCRPPTIAAVPDSVCRGFRFAVPPAPTLVPLR